MTMKEGSKAEVLGKTITKFITQNPNIGSMTRGEFKEMLAMISAISLYSQTKNEHPQVQIHLAKEYTELFTGIFNNLVGK